MLTAMTDNVQHTLDTHQPHVLRLQSENSNTSDTFIIKEQKYTQQYAGIYFTRLCTFRNRLLAQCEELKWNQKAKYISQVLNVPPREHSFVIGTVYIDMPLKPSILDKVTKEEWVLPPPPREKYTSESDVILLEDESGRIKLVGAELKQHIFMTGKLNTVYLYPRYGGRIFRI